MAINSSEFLYQPPSDNITSVTQVFQWVNSGTQNTFFPGMLIAVWLIIMIKLLFNPVNTASRSFATTSFIVMILSVFCRVLGFINTAFMSIFVVLTMLGAIWMYFDNQI